MKKLMFILPLALFMFACGSGEQKSETAETKETSSATKKPAASKSETASNLTIVGIDQMKFTVKGNAIKGVKVGNKVSGTKYNELYVLNEIEAKAGETITITLENNTKLPKQAMGHNFVLLKKNADVQAFVNASMGDAADDYIADDMENQIIAHTAMLGGGESETLKIKVPSEPGEYTFVCTFPGHYGAGMKGIIRVKA